MAGEVARARERMCVYVMLFAFECVRPFERMCVRVSLSLLLCFDEKDNNHLSMEDVSSV